MSSGDYISKSALIEVLEKSKEDNRHITGEGYGVHIQEHRHLIHLVEKQPTVDEKEIIRKTVERIFERLEEEADEWRDIQKQDLDNGYNNRFALGMTMGLDNAIEICKEEGGIE